MDSIWECREFNKQNGIDKKIIYSKKRKFKREKIIHKDIDECWSINLIDVDNFSKKIKDLSLFLLVLITLVSILGRLH